MVSNSSGFSAAVVVAVTWAKDQLVEFAKQRTALEYLQLNRPFTPVVTAALENLLCLECRYCADSSKGRATHDSHIHLRRLGSKKTMRSFVLCEGRVRKGERKRGRKGGGGREEEEKRGERKEEEEREAERVEMAR